MVITITEVQRLRYLQLNFEFSYYPIQIIPKPLTYLPFNHLLFLSPLIIINDNDTNYTTATMMIMIIMVIIMINVILVDETDNGNE